MEATRLEPSHLIISVSRYVFLWGGKHKPVFKDGMCDLRNGCCGCFIPYFPYRQFLEQVETSEMLFDLCQILLYTHTHTVRPPCICVRLLLCQREENIFRGNNSWCSFENVLKVNWLTTYKTQWLSCFSPGAVLLFTCVKTPYCSLIWGILFLVFPFYVNGLISTFQIVQLFGCAF